MLHGGLTRASPPHPTLVKDVQDATSRKKIVENFVSPNNYRTFAPEKRQGALDEWLSLRSAKPSTAVRIRQAPLQKES